VNVTDGLAALLAFVGVVALIPLALWLVKRSPLGAAAAGARGLRSVQTLPLSASQRIVTVEVGQGAQRRWLVLGVTPTSITTLHTMLPQDTPPAAPAAPAARATPAAPAAPSAPTAFSELLARLRAAQPPRDDRAAR
jgi:flagellar protein FliO/FliZ